MELCIFALKKGMLIEDIYYLFRNKTLNLLGVERDFIKLIEDRDIDKALNLMENNEDRVDEAIMEYYPEKHKVLKRPNKRRKKQDDYISTKMTRKRQQFINEVALFFLLNKPVKWAVEDSDHNEQMKLFKTFLRRIKFDNLLRQAKRLAGAETESALLFHVHKTEDNKADCQALVLARSTGYELRALIDQYNVMQAFAYGYKTKNGNKTVRHWDIQTSKFLFFCEHSSVGWRVDVKPNPTGKINVVYFKQDKEWEGVQGLCDREEDVMCRTSDNNNYFSDPIAKASADVIENIMSPESIGKFIQMEGDSLFEYIAPPNMAEGWRVEKEDLKSAILNDSFTPDFTYEGIKGYGTLSGSALRNALVIGYIKRSKNLEIWEPGVSRARSIMLSILKLMYPTYKWDGVSISCEFSDPFEDSFSERVNIVATAKSNGFISTMTAIQMLGVVDDINEELERIEKEKPKPEPTPEPKEK